MCHICGLGKNEVEVITKRGDIVYICITCSDKKTMQKDKNSIELV
jgi:hypothetical protein